MRIVDFDDIPPRMEAEIQLLDLTAGWGTMDFRRAKEARKLGYPAADYFGVYAVEDGKVEAMIRVLRLPFTTPRGEKRVAAIQGVVTRRDRSRRGLARGLMEEVLRREKEAGSNFALLWTGRAMVAHSLYNSLGYVDVYTPEIAVRKCERTDSQRRRYRLKRARKGDWALLERIHRSASSGRIGFTPRPDGLVRSLLELGFLELGPVRLVLRDDEPVGYGFLRKEPGWSVLDEMAVLPEVDRKEILPLFEAEAAGTWLTLRNTLVRDLLGTLRSRGYSVTDLAYYSLLAAPLLDRPADIPKALGVTSPSFTCQRLDYF